MVSKPRATRNRLAVVLLVLVAKRLNFWIRIPILLRVPRRPHIVEVAWIEAISKAPVVLIASETSVAFAYVVTKVSDCILVFSQPPLTIPSLNSGGL